MKKIGVTILVAAAVTISACNDRPTNPALLGLGAGMMAPTRTGSFGESLSNGDRGFFGADPVAPIQPYAYPAQEPSSVYCFQFGTGFMCQPQ